MSQLGGKPPTSVTTVLDVPGFRRIIRATMEHRGLNQRQLAAEAGMPAVRVHEFLSEPEPGEPDKPPGTSVLFALLAWQYPSTVGTLAVRRDPGDKEAPAADPDPLAA